jgi:hypothetical protein
MTPDNFDQRLRDALRAEPAPEQLARLEQFWLEQSRADRRRRAARRLVASAAASVAVIVAAWLAMSRRERAVPPQPELLAEAPRVESVPIEPFVFPAGAREPTGYERVIFAVRTSRPVDGEQALLERLRAASAPTQRRMIIARLAEAGTPRSVAELASAAEDPLVRGEAVAAIEAILGSDQLLVAIEQARSPQVRIALVARLLASDSATALDDYLALVATPGMRTEALAAALVAERLPIAALVSRLEAPRKHERLAAALVLGHVGGPEVGAALVERASQGRRASMETWVALLACRGEPVDRFLNQAARRPQALAQVNNARAYWARMMP